MNKSENLTKMGPGPCLQFTQKSLLVQPWYGFLASLTPMSTCPHVNLPHSHPCNARQCLHFHLHTRASKIHWVEPHWHAHTFVFPHSFLIHACQALHLHLHHRASKMSLVEILAFTHNSHLVTFTSLSPCPNLEIPSHHTGIIGLQTPFPHNQAPKPFSLFKY